MSCHRDTLLTRMTSSKRLEALEISNYSPGGWEFCRNLSQRPDRAKVLVLLDGKHPDHSTFGHFREIPRRGGIDACLHRPCVLTPPRDDGDILFAVYRKG